MNDEQFDRELGTAARQVAGGPASPGLHAFVASIPERRPRPAHRPSRFGIAWPFARLARPVGPLVALGVVVAVAAASLYVANGRGPAASAGPSPSVSPTPSSRTVTFPPTLSWRKVLTTSGLETSILRAGDTIATAIPFGNGFLLAGNAAYGMGAVVWRSDDGATWQRIDSGPSFGDGTLSWLVTIPGGVLAVGAAAGLDQLCGGGALGCNPVSPIRMWTSTDGRTWQRLPDSATAVFGRAQLDSIAAGPSGIVVLGYEVPVKGSGWAPREWISTDGRSWHLESQFGTEFPSSVVEGLASTSSGFVAVGRTGTGTTSTVPTAWSSPDGRTWTATAIPATTTEPTSIVAAESGVLASGYDATSVSLWGSASGRSWSALNPSAVPFSTAGRGPTLLSDGSRFVAIGPDHSGVGGVWTSTNGSIWQRISIDGEQGQNPPMGINLTGAAGPSSVLVISTGTTLNSSVWVATP